MTNPSGPAALSSSAQFSPRTTGDVAGVPTIERPALARLNRRSPGATTARASALREMMRAVGESPATATWPNDRAVPLRRAAAERVVAKPQLRAVVAHRASAVSTSRKRLPIRGGVFRRDAPRRATARP